MKNVLNKIIESVNRKPSLSTKGFKYFSEKYNINKDDYNYIKTHLNKKRLEYRKSVGLELKDNNKDNNTTTISPPTNQLRNTLKVVGMKEWTNSKGDHQYSYTYKSSEDYSELFKDFLNELNNLKKFKSNKTSREESDVLGVLNLPDFHFDQLDEMSIDENINLYLTTVDTLISSCRHEVNTIVLPIGNDFFNSDASSYKTTKGTPQNNKISWEKAFIEGYKLLISSIDLILDNEFNVIIPVVQGNHSRATEFYIGQFLQAYFKDDPNVKVLSDYSVIKAISHGNTLLAFTHGEIKSNQLPLLLATEFPKEWGNSKYREILCGHIHKVKTDEYNGVRVRFLPSLVKCNEWHKLQGYNHLSSAQLLYYSKEKGFIGLDEISL